VTGTATANDTYVPDEYVLVGTIERPHGLHGEVVVNPLTDFPEERFVPGAALLAARGGQTPAGGQTLRIDEVRWHKGRPLVRFEGIDAVETAEAHRGLGLWIAAADRPALEGGVFYETDLAGCAVETVAGEAVGTVLRLDGGPGATVLVVTGANGEVLVPFADEICRVIDPAARRIVIDPPAGLLELNAPPATPRLERRAQRRRGRRRGGAGGGPGSGLGKG
jgi:16S rRNA processing protein RimM